MLDSSDKLNEGSFDAINHILDLCKNSRVSVNPSTRIDYQNGWKKLIEEFFYSVKSQSITLLKLSEEFGKLDVVFDCKEKTMEVRVWRALHAAQQKSVSTCTACGGYATRRVNGDSVVVLCRKCSTKAEMNGETGTWLDRY